MPTPTKGSDDKWFGKAEQKGFRVRSQYDVSACVVAQDDFEENPSWLRLVPKRAHVEMLLTLRNTREQFGTKS